MNTLPDRVYVLANTTNDIHVFSDDDHLDPSVRMSYSACKDVKIERVRDSQGTTFNVSGYRDGEAFSESVVFKYLPIWKGPRHL